MESVYNIKEILKYLPHRYPFILVDRVLELEPYKKIVALKNVTINEHFFQGHFPDNPIMPGVIIVESMGQTGAILACVSRPVEKQGALIYFMGMDKVRFRQVVVPGDQLILELNIINLREKGVKMSAKATVEDKIVAQAEMLAAFGEEK